MPKQASVKHEGKTIFSDKNISESLSPIFFPLKVFGDISRKTKGRIRRILRGLGVYGFQPRVLIAVEEISNMTVA